MTGHDADRQVNNMVGVASLAIALTVVAAWVTHVLISIKASAWILLVVGIFVPPIGWVHGIGVWFGLV